MNTETTTPGEADRLFSLATIAGDDLAARSAVDRSLSLAVIAGDENAARVAVDEYRQRAVSTIEEARP